MSDERPRLDLTTPRDFGSLLRDSLRIYFQNFGRFLAVGAVVVIPAEVVVSGIGLGQLTAGFDEHPPVGANVIPLAVQTLVTTPLVVAMTIFVTLDLAAGRPVRLRAAIQSGLDAFAPIFAPVITAIACVAALALALVVPLVLAGNAAYALVALIPFALYVRWYFVPQSVVIDGARRLSALRASWELTRGSSWRVFGIVFFGQLGFGTIGALIASPIFSAARSADSGALVLTGTITWEVLAAPAVALLSVLLYFDLKARLGERYKSA